MNNEVHDSDFDSVLVLLPGSTITPEGIRLLCRISNFDHFIILNKLKIKLPQILCPINSHEIAGSSGDQLDVLRINFLAVKKIFFERPFNPFMVLSCRFGKKRSRFYTSHHHPVEIYNEEKILLIEGDYKTTDEKAAHMFGNDVDFDMGHQKVKAVYSKDLKTYRIVMLYQVMDPEPLVFIDRSIDYSFLESAKKMTVTANFNALKLQLEKTFCRKADQTMLHHGYVLKQVQNISEKKAKGLKLNKKKEIITTAISNEIATNRMSRLLFYQWCKDNGWVKRIIPGV
ncbi:MAG: hypothetical protein HF978_07855 [Desulfobacteraceae bacterium]|nr:hypothetical protein [Desulfobacteraceae bacterium]MBC2755444.1 hypothetical protein [Desulfobacteraceae bacterium]